MKKNDLIKVFENYISENQVSHAYIFESENQNELENFINQILKLFFCKNLNCDNCSFCLKIENKQLINCLFLGNGVDVIKKNEILKVINFVNTSLITKDQRKFYIIQNAENLNKESSNAILKTLEEPPSNTFAFLLTNNSGEIMQTIKSRCKYYFLNIEKNFLEENELIKIISQKMKNELFFYAYKLKKMNKKEIILILQDTFENLILKDFISLAEVFHDSIQIIKKSNVFNNAIENLFIKIYEVV